MIAVLRNIIGAFFNTYTTTIYLWSSNYGNKPFITIYWPEIIGFTIVMYFAIYIVLLWRYCVRFFVDD